MAGSHPEAITVRNGKQFFIFKAKFMLIHSKLQQYQFDPFFSGEVTIFNSQRLLL